MNPPIHIEEESLERDDRVVLSILEEFEKNPQTSQRSLANRLGIAVGLVNTLVKRIINKGFVTIQRVNRRNVHYLLTPNGVYEKSRLTYRFIRHSFRFLSHYRRRTYEVLSPYAGQDDNEVVIFGSGEEAELAYLAIRELGMKLIAIVDPVNAGHRNIGYIVQPLDWFIDQEKVQILLVLHSAKINDHFDQYRSIIQNHCEINHLLHITI